MKKMIPVLAILLVAVAAFFGLYQSRSKTDDGATLRVAMSGLYPPFNYFDERNKLVGFDVDIARELSGRLGRKPVLVTTAWDGILAGLVSGKYDVIIGSMAITDERKKSVDFSEPYYTSGARLIARRDSGISNISDLRGRVVGVTVGETYANYLRNHDPGMQRLAPYKGGVPNLLLELRNNRIDAFVTDGLVGLHALKVANSDAEPAGEYLYREEMGIALAKGNDALLAQINEALAAMKADGAYSRISARWFGRDILEME